MRFERSLEVTGLELQKWHGKRLRRGSEVCAVAESDGGGGAEMAWEEATAGKRGVSGC